MDNCAPSDITAIILAGGISRRFGRDKAVEPFAGEPMIRRVIHRSAEAVNAAEVLVVVGSLERAGELPLDPQHRVAVDAFPNSGSLGGIYTGLLNAQTEWGLVTACDMPFLESSLLQHMAHCRSGVDAVVPVRGGRPEPIHALYSRRCLPAIHDRLLAGELKISGFYDRVTVRYLLDDELKRFDPELWSFFNINRPEDLALAAEREQRQSAHGYPLP
ncbi:MAG: molybdenum cofactor guanylyltransferase [Chloroflexi bacterium]|nr:molybdenum cofactor guanylyltransferase [Chloroflexota bacterium]